MKQESSRFYREVVQISLEPRSYRQAGNEFALHAYIELCTRYEAYNRLSLSCFDLYSPANEDNLLSKFADIKTALSGKLNSLYQLALIKLNLEDFRAGNGQKPDYYDLQSVVEKYAVLSKFNSDRDF